MGATQVFEALTTECKAAVIPTILERRFKTIFPILSVDSCLMVLRAVSSDLAAGLLGTVTQETALVLLSRLGPASFAMVGLLPDTLAAAVVAGMSPGDVTLQSLGPDKLKTVLVLMSNAQQLAVYETSDTERKLLILRYTLAYRAAALVFANPLSTLLLAEIAGTHGDEVFAAYVALGELDSDSESGDQPQVQPPELDQSVALLPPLPSLSTISPLPVGYSPILSAFNNPTLTNLTPTLSTPVPSRGGGTVQLQSSLILPPTLSSSDIFFDTSPASSSGFDHTSRISQSSLNFRSTNAEHTEFSVDESLLPCSEEVLGPPSCTPPKSRSPPHNTKAQFSTGAPAEFQNPVTAMLVALFHT